MLYWFQEEDIEEDLVNHRSTSSLSLNSMTLLEQENRQDTTKECKLDVPACNYYQTKCFNNY